jgi:hypothetical protein
VKQLPRRQGNLSIWIEINKSFSKPVCLSQILGENRELITDKNNVVAILTIAGRSHNREHSMPTFLSDVGRGRSQSRMPDNS